MLLHPERLAGVHPDLVRVVHRAGELAKVSLLVVEGVRTLEKQKAYFAAGKSKTMKSRHLTGHAVDLAPMLDLDGDGALELSWERAHFYPVADAMRAAASKEGVAIEWGGDWQTFIDMPHWQLSWSAYP